MSYIGSTPTTQSFIEGTDYFNGDGSTTAFTLSRSVVSVNDIQATINNVVQQPNTAYTVSGTTITFTSAPSAGTANIYVRYLSTTTQSITPSQNTVSYSTLNSDNQSKLGISFKNKIINGACVIDQRNAGASITPSSGQTYGIDRWSYYGTQASKFSLQQNAGSVTPPAGFVNYNGITSTSAFSLASSDFFLSYQWIEGYNVADLNFGSVNAKTVTLSFWVRSSLTGSFGGVIANGAQNRTYPFSYTISAANTWTQISITIPGDTSGTWLTTNGLGLGVIFSLGAGATYTGTANAWGSSQVYAPTGSVNVVATNGATWYVTGVQLEVGTQATTFDYRSYGTELALCQRYYETTQSGIVATTRASSIYMISGCTFSVQKRAAPTVAIVGTLRYVFPAVSFATATSIASAVSDTKGAQIETNSNVSWTSTDICRAGVSDISSAGFYTFSAEL